jgi:TonB family protein
MDNGVVKVFGIACLTALGIYALAHSADTDPGAELVAQRIGDEPIKVRRADFSDEEPVAFPRPARPRTNPGTWLNTDDYPTAALIGDLEGTVRFTVEVDPFGEVTNCEITQSSGVDAFDKKVCAAVSTRARFIPAYDENQRPVVSTYSSSVRWQIPR